MSITLRYDFDDYYRRGPEAYRVKVNNFEYTIKKLSDEDAGLSLDDLKKKHEQDAFEEAAFSWICEYSDIL